MKVLGALLPSNLPQQVHRANTALLAGRGQAASFLKCIQGILPLHKSISSTTRVSSQQGKAG
jgi:hypothetical protein